MNNSPTYHRKKKIIKELNEIIFEILEANEIELVEIGERLLDIEKEILEYNVHKPLGYDLVDKK